MGERAHETVTPGIQARLGLALHVRQREAPLPRRLGVDEVRERLHLHQVQLAVVKRPARELARLSVPQPGHAA